jgi:hypothetical protein
MTFDAFIDSLGLGEDIKGELIDRQQAHRVKNFVDAEYNAPIVYRTFARWCDAREGLVEDNRTIDGKFALPIPPLGSSPYFRISGLRYSSMICMRAGKDLLGGYQIFSDRTIAFYPAR